MNFVRYPVSSSKSQNSVNRISIMRGYYEKNEKSLSVDRQKFYLRLNEWTVGQEKNSYFVVTAGCGAVKIFLKGDQTEGFIVFHCYANAATIKAVAEISNYIRSLPDRRVCVELINVQPYKITKSVEDTLSEMVRWLKQENERKGFNRFHIHRQTICLNNMDEKPYTFSVNICLDGTKQDILDRYSRYIIRTKKIPEYERMKKADLFECIPSEFITHEFIRHWSGLCLTDARKIIQSMQWQKKPYQRRIKAFLRHCINRLK